MNEFLRKECKMLKAMQGVSYKELAELLEVRQDSFYPGSRATMTTATAGNFG